MANASKRIQVGFKQHVLDALETFSEQSGDSLSRSVSVLVEEALISRGMLEAKAPLKPSLKTGWEEKLGSSTETTPLPTSPSIDEEDLKLLQKIKVLKELGVL